jgi:propanol-preferring alcohol dehydrogenase
MQAMVLKKVGAVLESTELPDRQPGPGEIRLKVAACGVCRTDLHVVDGELPDPKVPITPGHEIVGRIDAIGAGVEGLSMGERVGIPWLGHACGVCPYCVAHQENLCDRPLFTGYTRDGGFATATHGHTASATNGPGSAFATSGRSRCAPASRRHLRDIALQRHVLFGNR